MSTRSRIGIVREKPTDAPPVVESIYCHFDGYPEGVGQTLLDHWTDPQKIDRLIALGDLSCLGSVIGEKHDFDKHMPDTYGIVDEDEWKKAWNDPESPKNKGWTLAYGRDRGERDVGSVTHSMDSWPDYGQEAEYVFDPDEGEWKVRREALNPVGWNTVTPWEGWITIPEAIALEVAEREKWEREQSVALVS